MLCTREPMARKLVKRNFFYTSLSFPPPLDTFSICITPELWDFVEPDTSLGIVCIASVENNTVIWEILISAV